MKLQEKPKPLDFFKDERFYVDDQFSEDAKAELSKLVERYHGYIYIFLDFIIDVVIFADLFSFKNRKVGSKLKKKTKYYIVKEGIDHIPQEVRNHLF